MFDTAMTNDDDLDEALEETFPASDPPANTVETGVARGVPSISVSDNRAAARFELVTDGQLSFLTYRRTPTTLTLVHTEVPEALRGRGVGSTLVEKALDAGRREGLRTIVECPFAKAYVRQR